MTNKCQNRNNRVISGGNNDNRNHYVIEVATML